MALPDISALSIHDRAHVPIPDDIKNATDDRYMLKLKAYASSLPYPIESYAKMVDILDRILLRITQCIEAKDYLVGFLQWDTMLA